MLFIPCPNGTTCVADVTVKAVALPESAQHGMCESSKGRLVRLSREWCRRIDTIQLSSLLGLNRLSLCMHVNILHNIRWASLSGLEGNVVEGKCESARQDNARQRKETQG